MRVLPASRLAGPSRLVAKGAWAILDQGLFAVSNFVVSIVMARWLVPRDYGAFTLAYSIFLLLGTVHSALLVEPMMVFGAGRYRDGFAAYLAVLMRGHWLLTAAASALLAAIALALNLGGQTVTAASVLALAAAAPFILLLWLVRRVGHIQDKPHLAASGGLLYMAVLLAGGFALYRLGWLSSPAAFALMGLGSAASAAWIKSRLPATSRDLSRELAPAVATQHWEYGRWAVGSGMLGALMLNLYYFVMPIWHGLESTATLRALMNVMMPAQQTFLALWVVALPRLVSVRGTPAFGGLIRKLLMVYGAAAIANWLVLGVLHDDVIWLLYGGAYASDARLLWIAGLVPIGFAAISILENALRAIERSDDVFRAYVWSLSAICLVGIPLLAYRGVGGALAGLVTACVLSVGSLAWSLRARTAAAAPARA